MKLSRWYKNRRKFCAIRHCLLHPLKVILLNSKLVIYVCLVIKVHKGLTGIIMQLFNSLCLLGTSTCLASSSNPIGRMGGV